MWYSKYRMWFFNWENRQTALVMNVGDKVAQLVKCRTSNQ